MSAKFYYMYIYYYYYYYITLYTVDSRHSVNWYYANSYQYMIKWCTLCSTMAEAPSRDRWEDRTYLVKSEKYVPVWNF